MVWIMSLLCSTPNSPQTKVHSQSEPVDYIDLCRRLEIVAKEREAKKRVSRDVRRSHVAKTSRRNHDSSSSSATVEKSPPPSTAQATRPVSSMPPPTYNVRSSRLSLGASISNDRKRYSLAADLGDVRAPESERRASNRFSATLDRSAHASYTHDYKTLQGETTSQQLASLSNTPAQVGEPIVKRGSKRQVQVVNRSVPKKDSQDAQYATGRTSTSSQVLPSSKAEEDYKISFDATETCLSDISSATTEVAAHSTSSSRSDRKPWYPRTYAPRHKERQSDGDAIMALPILEHPTFSEPSLHELVLAKADVNDATSTGTSPTVAVWDKPIPRPQATAFEPFRFHDYSFSGASDMSSNRASDYHNFFFSDLDSGIGLSENGSAVEGEEMPTLMNGAERRPDWSVSEANLAAKRDSHFGIPQTCESPVRRPYRESTLRREVSMHEAFDFHPDLALLDDPPEDEGIVVSLALDEPSPLPASQPEPLLDGHPTESDLLGKPDKIRRRTFDPRQLFATPKRFSVKRNSSFVAPTQTEKAAETVVTEPFLRPMSRSQPIMIMPHHQVMLNQRSSYIGVSSLPMQSLPSLPSTNISAATPRSAQSRPRTANHIPIIPKIPAVPAFELAHMTPESLALLREQERVLVHRSTMSATPAEQAAQAKAAANASTIGMAISSDGTFVRPPMPPIPVTAPVLKSSLTAQSSMEVLHTAFLGAASKSTTDLATPTARPGRVRRLPTAAKSMLDMHHAATTSALDTQGGLQKRKKWWKPWRRS